MHAQAIPVDQEMCCNGSSGYENDSSDRKLERKILKQQRKIAKAEAKLAKLQHGKLVIDTHKHIQISGYSQHELQAYTGLETQTDFHSPNSPGAIRVAQSHNLAGRKDVRGPPAYT